MTEEELTELEDWFLSCLLFKAAVWRRMGKSEKEQMLYSRRNLSVPVFAY